LNVIYLKSILRKKLKNTMKIERYFVLNKYLLSLFGVDDFKDLQQKLKDAQEGVDSDGRTYFVNTLISAFSNRKISEENLLRYDENIQDYVRKINFKRGNVSLKYFQYLAVLFTEIVLDNLKNRKLEFVYELNVFLSRYKYEEVKVPVRLVVRSSTSSPFSNIKLSGK